MVIYKGCFRCGRSTVKRIIIVTCSGCGYEEKREKEVDTWQLPGHPPEGDPEDLDSNEERTDG